MKKNILSFILVFCIAFMAFPSIATSVNQLEPELTLIPLDSTGHIHENFIGSNVVSPNVVAACPYGNGICDAVSSGIGKVYMNGNLVINGGAYQCSKCYTVYVTQNSPLSGSSIGNWASRGWSYPISYNGCIMEVTSINYTSSSSIPGISFRLLEL